MAKDSLDDALIELRKRAMDYQREIRLGRINPTRWETWRSREVVLACYGFAWELCNSHKIDPPKEPVLNSADSCINALGDLFAWIHRANQSANFSALFPQGVPEESDIVDLVLRLQSAKQSGQSMNEIARKFTHETPSHWTKAKRLLARIRKMRRQGRIVF